jgi:hypothetical protein
VWNGSDHADNADELIMVDCGLDTLSQDSYTLMAFANSVTTSVPEQSGAVTTRTKARAVFCRSNTEIMGSSPTPGMQVCKHLLCVCVCVFVLCLGSSLWTGLANFQGAPPTVYRIKERKAAKAQQRARTDLNIIINNNNNNKAIQQSP